jgi:hypothetical protein
MGDAAFLFLKFTGESGRRTNGAQGACRSKEIRTKFIDGGTEFDGRSPIPPSELTIRRAIVLQLKT